ncbi:MAG: sterol desaturase family protein [Porticoccaceae bacterium]|nr:sterol desaturase family protein [Porticoccaceae bacterium]MDG1473312.1 sterol desaturase family protein [Porticoccaceae bacterium]
MLTIPNVYAVGLPIIAGLIIFEAMFSAYKKRNYYHLNDITGTAGLLIGNIVLSPMSQLLIISGYFYLYSFSLIKVSAHLPSWGVWVATFLAIDLVFYGYHRASHRVRLLWAVHMSHHSSVQMNFTIAFRQAWFGPLSKVPFFIALPLIGFDPSITAVTGVCSTLWGVIGHTQLIDRLGWLDKIFNAPSTHRVHHGTNPQYTDRNYGNLPMIWDRLFGTYIQEKEPVTFGLVENLGTNNPTKNTFHTYAAMANDIKSAASFYDILGYIFGPPDWQSKSNKPYLCSPSLLE